MNNNISLLFFIIATGLVVTHVAMTAIRLDNQLQQHDAVYRVLRDTERFVFDSLEAYPIDYKQLAEHENQASSSKGW